MSLHILCTSTETGEPVTPTCTGGKLDVNATVQPAEGGATANGQDTGNNLLNSIDGKTPALGQALAAASVPVVLPTAQIATLAAPVLGAGTAVVGSVVCTNTGGTATFPTASALSDASAGNPTTTKIGAVIMGREENSDTLRRIRATSQNELYVQPLGLSMGTTSRSTGTYQAQRGINFGCAPAFIRVYSRLAGYILLVNKGSAAANTDVPYGGDVFKIVADSTIQIDMTGIGESFTSGCQVVLSSTPEVVTLPGTSDLLVTIVGN